MGGLPPVDRADVATRFEYDGPVIQAGRGAIGALGDELDRHGLETVVLVTSASAYGTDGVRQPLQAAIGGRTAAVIDAASADKRLGTAIEAAETARHVGADAVVGLGAGSSLDVATVTAALAGSTLEDDTVRAYFEQRHTLPIDRCDPLPLVTVPTTLAGAELSDGAGITSVADDGTTIGGGVRDPALMPLVAVYDGELVEHTPAAVLSGSAMNGFDKGLEALYAPTATPVTDGTATRGLGILRERLPALGDGADGGDVDAILEGMSLVQYGLARPDASGMSVIHAFGHGITAVVDVQQGVAHAVMAPVVLEGLFERGDCRRALLAHALGVEGSDPAQGVVAAVREVRDGLGVPTRLRDVGGLDRDDLPAIARATADDRLLENTPPGVTLDADDVEGLLERAW